MTRKSTKKTAEKPKADPHPLLDYVATATCWIDGRPRKEGDPVKLSARAAQFEPVILASEVGKD